jgi:5-enolpyruvylshikimate-3-phosphate synthase
VLAGRAADSITIEGAGGIPTSFPGFAATLRELGGRVEPGAAVSA